MHDSITKRIEKRNVQYITIGHIHYECGFEGIIGCNQSGKGSLVVILMTSFVVILMASLGEVLSR